MFDPLGPIWMADPVVRDHPLNRGRVAWWLAVPPLDGGRQWVDLMGLYPGTLVGMTAAGSGWRPSTRPGGWGHVHCAGAGSHVSIVGTVPVIQSGNQLAVSCWFRPGVLTRCDLVTRWNSTGPFNLLYGLTSGKPQFFVSNATEAASTGTAVGPTTLAVGEWHHLVGVYDGVNSYCYLDGILQGTAAPGYTLPGGTGYTITLGDNFAGSGPTTGDLDDVGIWPRALSAAEVRALYDESRAGYPRTLSRWPSRVHLLGQSVVSVSFALIGAVAALTPALTLSAAAPASASASLAATAGPQSFSGSLTASAPAAATVALAAALGDATASFSLTATAPAAATLTLTATAEPISASLTIGGVLVAPVVPTRLTAAVSQAILIDPARTVVTDA